MLKHRGTSAFRELLVQTLKRKRRRSVKTQEYIGSPRRPGTNPEKEETVECLSTGVPRFLRELLVQTLKRKRQLRVSAQEYIGSPRRPRTNHEKEETEEC